MRTESFRDQVQCSDTLNTRGYAGTPASLEPGSPSPCVWGTRGAGGIWSSVGDIYRFLVAVENDRIVPEKQRRPK
jgi:hypothetical protein